jgi:heme exporter protein A
MSENQNPGSPPDKAILVKDLRKNFGFIQAVRGVSFELRCGEFLTLFGPNGAGKTTLVKILSSLTRATSGEAYVAGHDVSRGDPGMRGKIGVISHVSMLYENLSPLENLLFYARMYGIENPHDRAVRVIDEVGLRERMHDRVRTFSRGMLQRLSIARAIIHNPSVLFLDEPYTGLDQHACGILKEQLNSLRTSKRTIVLITHDLERGLEMCDRVAVLVKGRIAFMERIDDVDAKNFGKRYSEIVDGETR